MTEAAEGSDATVGAWQDVYRADAAGYETVRGGFVAILQHLHAAEGATLLYAAGGSKLRALRPGADGALDRAPHA